MARDQSRAGRAGWWPFAFVTLSLVALVILPVVQSRRIAALEEEISGILGPAAGYVQQMGLIQARQLARFQLYLLAGERVRLSEYRSLRAEENTVHQELTELIRLTDLEIRGELAGLRTASLRWDLEHLEAFGGEESRLAYLERIPEDMLRFNELSAAWRALESAIDLRTTRARNEMASERLFQTQLTLILGALALGATAGLGVIGGRLREAVTGASQRRTDAVRARREVTAVMEATGDGVMGLDLDGGCTSLNRAGSELLAMTEVDARGRTVHDLLHNRAPGATNHEADDCPLLLALGSGQIVEDSDATVWRRDGTSFPARLQLRPQIDGREVRGGVVTISDMTEIREAEGALRQAVRARDEVVAVVSHDLRSPLSTISAAADLLVELDLSPESEEEQLKIIQRSSNRMARLIKDLLDVARIEAGALAVDPRPMKMGPLLHETVELYRSQAGELEIALSANVPDNLSGVLAERARIEQVLSNLVANSIRFTPSGGQIRLEAEEEEDAVAVSVQDSGAGISTEALEHLFDRFWRADAGGGKGGTGLGLTIVRGTVEAHGGTISVESEPGEGSTFRFTLPKA